ncbi:somatostatin receptor type 1-like [Pollicipes pollicipes]|uniref:somatostatin receptor type 1-like n=1 Tax=Pollicipes pollicipes TaxID=41117 RepID=UPI0018857315|nr:somatostatin receptor type 1-like [Pollicipes pollicipes]
MDGVVVAFCLLMVTSSGVPVLAIVTSRSLRDRPMFQLIAHMAGAGAAFVAALLVVSLERYVAVEHGLRYFTLLTPRRVQLLHAGVWVLALLMASPHLAHALTAPAPAHAVPCSYSYHVPGYAGLVAELLISILLVAAVLVVNATVGLRGVQQDREIQRQQAAGGQMATSSRHQALFAISKLALLTCALQLPKMIVDCASLTSFG